MKHIKNADLNILTAKTKTDVLLLLITKRADMLIKQTKTKRQETLEYKITKLSQSSF